MLNGIAREKRIFPVSAWRIFPDELHTGKEIPVFFIFWKKLASCRFTEKEHLYPNRTITGRFSQNIIYYFRSSDSKYGSVSIDTKILLDYRDVEGGDEIDVIPTTLNRGQFVEWIYINSDGTQDKVLSANVTIDNRLLIDNAQYLENYYPSGTEFIAKFKGPDGESGDETSYTVTIKIAEWVGGRWFVSSPTPYRLSWTSTWDSNGPTTLTKKFVKGESCTIYWAGSNYEAKAITDSSHTIVQYVTGKSSYSFKVTQSVTYYVEMVEIR